MLRVGISADSCCTHQYVWSHPYPLGEFMQDIKNSVRKFVLDNFVMGGNVVIADDTSFMKAHILDSTGFIE